MLRLKRNDNLEIVNIAEVIMSVRERVKKLDKFHLLTKNKKKQNLWYFRNSFFLCARAFLKDIMTKRVLSEVTLKE